MSRASNQAPSSGMPDEESKNENPSLKKSSQSSQDQKVAIKILEISRIKARATTLRNLISEIRVNWVLEKCDGMLGLQEIYEDSEFIYLVLDY